MNYNKSAPFQYHLSELWALIPSIGSLRLYLYSFVMRVLSSEYFYTLRKHKLTLLSFTLASFFLAYLIAYSFVPRYIAVGVMSAKPELNLLKSEILAQRVITELNMEDSLQRQVLFKPFAADLLSPLIGYRELIKEYLGLKGRGLPHQVYSLSLEDTFFDRLVLHRNTASQSVDVMYGADNPQGSILIVNTYLEHYKKLYEETQNTLAMRRKQSLRQQLLQTRMKLHEVEREFIGYIINKYINRVEGKNDSIDKVINTLDLNYISVEQMRIHLESNAVMLSDASSIGNGSYHEGIIEGDMALLENQLLTYEGQSSRAIGLFSEVQLNRGLYQDLLQRLKRVAGIKDTVGDIAFTIDQATALTVSRTPNTWIYGLVGLLSGFIFGVIFVSIRYFLNQKIDSVEELKALSLPYPVLSTLNSIKRVDKRNLALLAVNSPQSSLAHSIHDLQAALTKQQGIPQLMMVTSTLPGEAKSSIVTNLASVLAKSNKRVLIIDANLRNPTIHKQLDIDNQHGLSNYLADEDNATLPLCKVPGSARLFVIPAGPTIANPVALLASEKMQFLSAKVKEGFDHIIIDAPSVSGMSDSLVLSNIVDYIVVAVSSRSATISELRSAVNYLEKSHAVISGFVFTKAKRNSE